MSRFLCVLGVGHEGPDAVLWLLHESWAQHCAAVAICVTFPGHAARLLAEATSLQGARVGNCSAEDAASSDRLWLWAKPILAPRWGEVVCAAPAGSGAFLVAGGIYANFATAGCPQPDRLCVLSCAKGDYGKCFQSPAGGAAPVDGARMLAAHRVVPPLCALRPLGHLGPPARSAVPTDADSRCAWARQHAGWDEAAVAILQAPTAPEARGLHASLYLRRAPLPCGARWSSAGMGAAPPSHLAAGLEESGPGADAGGGGQPVQVAVLLGSLLRGIYFETILRRLNRLFADPASVVAYRTFIYTSLLTTNGCWYGLSRLQHVEGLRFIEMSEADMLAENAIVDATRTPHLRQWFKLVRAMDMMKEYEARVGRQFDLVLKLRSDIVFPVLHLADFPELFLGETSPPVVYGYTDMNFLARRDVAAHVVARFWAMLPNFTGRDDDLLPLNYDALARSQLFGSSTYNMNFPAVPGLAALLQRWERTHQNFSDFVRSHFHEMNEGQHFPELGVHQARLWDMAESFRAFLGRHRGQLADRHQRADAAGGGVAAVLPIEPVTGAWWRQPGAREKAELAGRPWSIPPVASGKYWAYCLQLLGVEWRPWPGLVMLMPERREHECSNPPPYGMVKNIGSTAFSPQEALTGAIEGTLAGPLRAAIRW